jgi:hypothetical protein
MVIAAELASHAPGIGEVVKVFSFSETLEADREGA